MKPTPAMLSSLLKTTFFADKLKFVYRPYICPFHEILPLISDKDRVLDIGCGAGQFMYLIKQVCGPAKLTGLEISENLTAACKKSNLEAVLYDGFNLPEFAAEYNTFTMVDVLHHIPAKKQLTYIQNIYKSMPRGARLILKDIDAGNPLVLFNKLHDFILSRQISRERSASVVRKYCEDAGFRVLHSEKKRMLWYPHFWLVMVKE